MKERTHTTPFNTGAYAQKETAEPVDKFTNRSKMKRGGGLIHDGLAMALGHRISTLPRGNMKWHHSKASQPRGAHYSPAGAFGHMQRTGAGKGVYGYGGNVHSAQPTNAVGNPPHRHGENAVGSPPNRHGSNAIGNPPNRLGSSALGSDFRPRFGKPHGHRA